MSLAKFEGKNLEMEVLTHMAYGKSFLEGDHVFLLAQRFLWIMNYVSVNGHWSSNFLSVTILLPPTI